MEENKQNQILKEMDQSVLDTLETVNNEDTPAQQAGIAIQAAEILSRTRNEMRKTDAEIEKMRVDAELKRVELETEKIRAENDKQKVEAEKIKAEAEMLKAENDKLKAQTEALRLENEVKATDIELQKFDFEVEQSIKQAKTDKIRYWCDHAITAVGLVSVLHYEQANIIGSKLFNHVWGSFARGMSNVGKLFKRH